MSRASQVAIIISFILVFLTPLRVFASTYGSNSYGTSNYGGVTTTTTSLNTTPDAGCAKSAPGSAPSLYGALQENASSVRLYFTDSADPIDHYVLKFGTQSGVYPWGASDIGKKGSRTYVVQSLTPNTTYYFRIRGGNGCAVGAWSNELAVKMTAKGALTKQTSGQLTLSPELFPPAGPAPSPVDQTLRGLPLASSRPTAKPLPPTSPTPEHPTSFPWIVVAIIAGGSIGITALLFLLKKKEIL